MKLIIWPLLEIESNASVLQHDITGASKEVFLNMNKAEKKTKQKNKPSANHSNKALRNLSLEAEK